MALRLSFFRTPKHRVFNYKPLYYNEQKEDLEKRVARAEEEAGIREPKKYVPGREIRHNFRKSFYHSKRRPSQTFFARLVVLVSLVGLMVALYYIAQLFGLFFV